MPMFTVSIAFDPSRHAWVVCRARTVVETHASRSDAIRSACEMAIALHQRMHCGMRLKVRDENDGWHTYALTSEDRSPSTKVLRLLHKIHSGMPGSIATCIPESTRGHRTMTKTILARITGPVAHHHTHA